MSEIEISPIDIKHLELIRKNVDDFMNYSSEKYASVPGKLLDIAPQLHKGARPFFNSNVIVETLDIDPYSNADYIADICSYNHNILNNTYDYIVCTEVLEHTLQPFNAVNEIYRILKPMGYLFLSVPFNFRIHGPLPDCWRFTEYGLKELLKEFNIVEINCIETQKRNLMPIHYTVIATK